MSIQNLEGHGAPNERTKGKVGDIYTNLDTGITYELIKIYSCTGFNKKKTAEYIWKKNDSEGGTGVTSYPALLNKPSINGVELSGNKTTADLGIVSEVDPQEIVNAVNSYMTENPVEVDEVFRWQHVTGEITPNSMYNWKTKAVESAGNQYTTLRYILNGEKKLRISGASSGSSAKLGYVFLDESGAVLASPAFVSGELFENTVLDVPAGAYEIRLNGNNYESPHLEVAITDNMSDTATLSYLLSTFGKKLQYKDNFAWKPMEKAKIAFTFDDSLDDISSIVDIFIAKGVPCCFGAVPDKLNMSTSAGETIAQAMQRGIDAVGCEVLAHGNNDEMVTEDNIDDVNFLYNKFVVNNQKFADCGFNVRGVVRVGGTGNICNDPRTDEWVKLVYDYGDLYGIAEPYNHPRISVSSEAAYKEAIDTAVANKTFEPLLFHAKPDYLEALIDYVIAAGADICTYATAYDTYGSTVDEVSIETRLQNLENIANGNEVEY